MTPRERLSTTLGIMLAGLLQAEDAETSAAEAASRPPPRRRSVHKESGVYPLGDALEAASVQAEPEPESDPCPSHGGAYDGTLECCYAERGER